MHTLNLLPNSISDRQILHSFAENFYLADEFRNLTRAYPNPHEQVLVLGKRFHATVRGVEGRAAKTFSEAQWTAIASKWLPEVRSWESQIYSVKHTSYKNLEYER